MEQNQQIPTKEKRVNISITGEEAELIEQLQEALNKKINDEAIFSSSH